MRKKWQWFCPLAHSSPKLQCLAKVIIGKITILLILSVGTLLFSFICFFLSHLDPNFYEVTESRESETVLKLSVHRLYMNDFINVLTFVWTGADIFYKKGNFTVSSHADHLIHGHGLFSSLGILCPYQQPIAYKNFLCSLFRSRFVKDVNCIVFR